MKRLLVFLLLVPAMNLASAADVMDDFATLQTQWEETLLDAYAGRVDNTAWQKLRQTTAEFAQHFTNPNSRALWAEAAAKTWTGSAQTTVEIATAAGQWRSRFEQVFALETLSRQKAGHVGEAQQWRALVDLPKHANAVEGALALQRLGAQESESQAVSELLAREFVSWTTTRVQEKLDDLKRALAAGHGSRELLAARLSEIDSLRAFPQELQALIKISSASPDEAAVNRLIEAAGEPAKLSAQYAEWRSRIESSLPNLLTDAEVTRRETLLLKLLALVPKEYSAGVRDGEIVVPLEYREAQMFMVQAQQLVNELSPAWRSRRAAALEKSGALLREQLDAAEALIAAKAAPAQLAAAAQETAKLLQSSFGIALRQTGRNLVDDTMLEVRASLRASLAAALAGKWRDAEAARLDAYTSFDSVVEKRVLPRAPELGRRTERMFLDGDENSRGIKNALDLRLRGPELEQVYRATLAQLDQCQALLKVAVSPMTVAITTATVVAREGIEAVVILAALLAGLRGQENVRQRKWVISGVWTSLVFIGITFWVSRTVISSLSGYGEKLEAVVSILAVGVLLMVTNWIFHKVYWVKWNVNLRRLTRAVEQKSSARWECIGLIGVGFLTVYREGFETSLFLQSLILEGGMRAAGIGLAVGAAFIATVGVAIWGIGARLPYRKLLVVTGLLVVTILVTFLGSTVRLFQTVGWMPIHPITSLHIPTWVGLWFGVYPSWEGLLIPPAGLFYVGAAWLFTKWRAWQRNAAAAAEQAPLEIKRFAMKPN